MNEQIKDYLEKYCIQTEEHLARHIEELKRNTYSQDIVFQLVDVLFNDRDSLLNFFSRQKIKNSLKEIGNATQKTLDRVITLHFNNKVYKDISTDPNKVEFHETRTEQPVFSPDSEIRRSARDVSKVMERVEEYQANIGGRVELNDFDFGGCGEIKKNLEEREQEVIENLNKKDRAYYEASTRILEPVDLPPHFDYRAVGYGSDYLEFLKKFYSGEYESQKFNYAIKETENKVDYGELDWDYVDGIAKRMSDNVKYPPENWKRELDIRELAKSSMRHARKILQAVDNDPETLEDHCFALGANGMMINYQLKVKNNLNSAEKRN